MDNKKSEVFDSIVERLRLEFLEEAQERLTEIDEALGAEASHSMSAADAITMVRRQAHNLKGMGASFQFPIISLIAHRLEDYVANIKDLDDRHFRDVGQFVDAMRAVLEKGSSGLTPSDEEQANILRSLPVKWTRDVINVPPKDIEFLLVTTSKVSGRFVERELCNCGYRVVSTHSPMEAFELGVRMKPDMLITAMVMNEISGLDLARAFGAMQATREVPVGLLTSLDLDHPDLQHLPDNTAIIRVGDRFQDDLAAAITRFHIA